MGAMASTLHSGGMGLAHYPCATGRSTTASRGCRRTVGWIRVGAARVEACPLTRSHATQPRRRPRVSHSSQRRRRNGQSRRQACSFDGRLSSAQGGHVTAYAFEPDSMRWASGSRRPRCSTSTTRAAAISCCVCTTRGRAAVDRQRPARLVARPRPCQPAGMPDEAHPLLRHAVVGQGGRQVQGRDAPAHGRVALQPVHARRAGSADLHGEDRARPCPNIDSKFYAATQVIDEASSRRGLQPIPPREDRARLPAERQPRVAARRRHLDSRWDMTYLGMQVLIEGPRTRSVRRPIATSGGPAGAGAQRVRDAGRGATVMFGRSLCATTTRN
jgi:hypothetical protein